MSIPTEPQPRSIPLPWTSFDIVYGRTLVLPRVIEERGMLFDEVLERRRSARALTQERLRSVAAILTQALAARHVATDPSNPRFLSPVLSAGALHSVEVFLVRGLSYPVAFHYDAVENTLKHISGVDRVRLIECVESCRAVLPLASGDFLFLVGMTSKLSAFYTETASLLWRDAGAQLQVLALVAEAKGAGFCPLGITGAGIVQALNLPERALPVGVAAIGAKRP